jgi:hypothetical protein
LFSPKVGLFRGPAFSSSLVFRCGGGGDGFSSLSLLPSGSLCFTFGVLGSRVGCSVCLSLSHHWCLIAVLGVSHGADTRSIACGDSICVLGAELEEQVYRRFLFFLLVLRCSQRAVRCCGLSLDCCSSWGHVFLSLLRSLFSSSL